jgi:small-conductance mechanosensitive channel
MAIVGQEQLYKLVYEIFLFILIIIGTATSAKIASVLIDKTIKTYSPFFVRIKQYVSILIWAVGIIIGIRQVGIPTDILMLFIALVGIGFIVSAKYFLQNFVSRSFLNLQMQYKVGDMISIKDFTGKVIEITDLNTVLIDKENKLITVPNAHFLNEIWIKHRSISAGYEMTVPVVLSREFDTVNFEKELLLSIKGLENNFKKEPSIVTSKTDEKTLELSLILNLKDAEKKSVISVEINEILKNLKAEFASRADKEKKEAKLKEIKDISDEH